MPLGDDAQYRQPGDQKPRPEFGDSHDQPDSAHIDHQPGRFVIAARSNSPGAGRSVVSKVAEVLRCFDGARSATLTELSQQSNLPLSTAHRIVTELVSSGVLRRTEQGHYALQPLFSGGTEERFSRTAGHDKAAQILDDLAAVTRKVARIGRLHDNQVAYSERVPDRPGLSHLEWNEHRPLHADAMGKVLLAFSRPQVLQSVVRHPLPQYTKRTITHADELIASLVRTQHTGLAYNWGEFDEDKSAIAGPVFGPGGRLLAALELQITGESESDHLEAALLVAARILGRQLAADGQIDPAAR